MLFVNYRLIEIIGSYLLLGTIGVWGYRATRDRKGFLVWFARLAAIGLSSLCSLFLLVMGCESLVMTTTTRSAPIYSADHRYAVLVSDLDGGAIGGDTWVEAFSDYGFRSGQILHGGWKIVEARDIHWQSNSELVVEYPTDTGYDAPRCENFATIKVTCRPSDRRTWQH